MRSLGTELITKSKIKKTYFSMSIETGVRFIYIAVILLKSIK